MKLTVFAIALLIVSVHCATPKKGKDIVSQLEGIELDGDVFVIFFYDPSCCKDPDRTMNDDVKQEVEEKILSTTNGKNYVYYEVDTSNSDMKPVTELMNVDAHMNKYGPTVLIACSGVGYWAHGRDAATKVAGRVSKYDSLHQEAMEKVKKRDELIN